MQFVPILVFGFATSLGLTPLSRQIAMRLGVVDKPNHRKIHLDHKPLMGGLAIYVAFTLSLLLFGLPQHMVQLGAILAGAAFLAFVGLLDDRYELGIKSKLVAQVIAAAIVIASGIYINLFKTPWLDYPLTVLWIVALTNAVNFLDNMDGLTAGLSAIAATFFMGIAFAEGLTLVSSLAAAVLGSAVGFLVYNFSPASSFMGDMGALVLGFVLANLGIKLEFSEQPFSVTWMVPLLVLALPLFDICLVVVTRISEGRSPGQAGKDHTSHRLLSMGLSQRKTLIVLYLACIFFGVLGWVVSSTPTPTAYAVGIFGLVLLAVLYALMFLIRRRYQLAK
jgi:UDP-GlcNAc:undecaprenyl-phosphate GlcNAc-1-phosphate transferase